MLAQGSLLVWLGIAAAAPAAAAPAVDVPASCPVTRPPDPPFTPPAPYPALPLWTGSWYGTPALWVAVMDDGTWRGRRTEKGYRNKLFVWREGFHWRDGYGRKLSVKGRRLDQEAPPFVVTGTNAYLCDKQPCHWALLAGLDIPLGCWELTATYEEDTLAFVVWVVP